ncbi:Rv3235 family protein [Brevibacterium litoralis]|uniref:Rv3235 family protein n=1 Tax=Brevibacterium litoralis TaxID=3138935 RepID=UPI0032EFAB51
MTSAFVLTRPLARPAPARPAVLGPGASAPGAPDPAATGPVASAAGSPPPDDHDGFLETAVRSLVVALLQVRSGERAAASIARWVSPELLDRLRTHATLRQELARGAPPHDQSTRPGVPRLCHVDKGIVEASVVLRGARRARAAALRLEYGRGRWTVTRFLCV